LAAKKLNIVVGVAKDSVDLRKLFNCCQKFNIEERKRKKKNIGPNIMAE